VSEIFPAVCRGGVFLLDEGVLDRQPLTAWMRNADPIRLHQNGMWEYIDDLKVEPYVFSSRSLKAVSAK